MKHFKKCDACGFHYPQSYDGCPLCIHGLDISVMQSGRITCSNCGTIVGQYLASPIKENVEKCDYCDPPPNAKDEDIVSRFFISVYSKTEKPKRVSVTYTRAEIRKQKEDNEKFLAHIMSIMEGKHHDDEHPTNTGNLGENPSSG